MVAWCFGIPNISLFSRTISTMYAPLKKAIRHRRQRLGVNPKTETRCSTRKPSKDSNGQSLTSLERESGDVGTELASPGRRTIVTSLGSARRKPSGTSTWRSVPSLAFSSSGLSSLVWTLEPLQPFLPLLRARIVIYCKYAFPLALSARLLKPTPGARS